MTTPSCIVLDIETVPDEQLFARVKGNTVGEWQTEQLDHDRSAFVPATFQYPVSIVVASLGDDWKLQRVSALDAPKYRRDEMVRTFWCRWKERKCPKIVTYAGGRFDMRVLEMESLRLGLSIPEWFVLGKPAWENPRHRFNTSAHFDLLSFLTAEGAGTSAGGLDLACKLVGLPGKVDTSGDDVAALFAAGEIERIQRYCMTDVLNTVFLFWRVMLLCGEITPNREGELHKQALPVIEALANEGAEIRAWLESLGREAS